MNCPFALLQLNLWATRDQIDSQWLKLSSTLGESVADDARARAFSMYGTLQGARELRAVDEQQQRSTHFAHRRRIIELVQILYRQEYFTDENTQPSDTEGLLKIKATWSHEDRAAAEDMFENGVGDCKAKLHRAEERISTLLREYDQAISRHRAEVHTLRVGQVVEEVKEEEYEEIKIQLSNALRRIAELEDEKCRMAPRHVVLEETSPEGKDGEQMIAERMQSVGEEAQCSVLQKLIAKPRKRKQQQDEDIKLAINAFVKSRLTQDADAFVSTQDLLTAFKAGYVGDMPSEMQFSKEMRSQIHAEFTAVVDKRTSQARGYCGIRILSVE